jgi:hypothetical protein
MGRDGDGGAIAIAIGGALRAHPERTPLLRGLEAGPLVARLQALADLHAPLGLRPGEPVALELRNDEPSVIGLLLVLWMGGACLALPPGAPPDERERLMRMGGCRRRLLLDGGDPRLDGPPSAPSEGGAGVLLPTSGSTGAPTLVFRSLASLREEAARYRRALGLGPGHRVLVMAPLSHAYALGWLAAALWAGCEVLPVHPTDLGRAAREMGDGVDWMVLTPALAQLLARRPLPPAARPADRLQVMVGAGPVDAGLEGAFRRQFGTGLHRNYGSTETGAVCSGGAGLPDGCVGSPMPGVEVRLESGAEEGGPAALQVRLEDGRWRPMGDLATIGPDRLVTLHGRISQSVRRGDQWISPREVEEVALAEGGSRAVRAAAEAPPGPGADARLVLHVWPEDPASFDPEALHRALRQRLSSPKWPSEVRGHPTLRVGGGGKVQAPPVYRLAGAAPLLEAARASKRAELAFALHGLGVLRALQGGSGRTAHQVAAELGLDGLALELALEHAERLGLVTRDEGAPDARLQAPDERLLELEAALSRGWSSRERLAEAIRHGLRRRPPPPGRDRVVPLYQAAMHGEIAAFRRALGLRRLRLEDGTRVVEITSGPGDYCLAVTRRWPASSARLWQVGELCGPPHPELPVASGRVVLGAPDRDEAYDAAVIFNAIHGAEVAGRLASVVRLLRPGGRLLVDDLFLGPDGLSAELGIDWLSHGGAALQTVEEVRGALERLGVRVEVLEVPGSAHARLVLAHREEAAG